MRLPGVHAPWLLMMIKHLIISAAARWQGRGARERELRENLARRERPRGRRQALLARHAHTVLRAKCALEDGPEGGPRRSYVADVIARPNPKIGQIGLLLLSVRKRGGHGEMASLLAGMSGLTLRARPCGLSSRAAVRGEPVMLRGASPAWRTRARRARPAGPAAARRWACCSAPQRAPARQRGRPDPFWPRACWPPLLFGC
jgi:hypothetical protein